MEELKINDMQTNMVCIPIKEYRELIEERCEAKADADRRWREWSAENDRANKAEDKYADLRKKYEEVYKALLEADDTLKAYREWSEGVKEILVEEGLTDKFVAFKGSEANGRN